MRYERSQVRALPLSRRRMMPPSSLQNSFSSLKRSRGTARCRARFGVRVTEQLLQERTRYLEVSQNVVDSVELESLLGPDDLDVDFRQIIEEARGKKGCAIL